MRITIDHPTNRPNFTNVTIGDVDLWFSYRTLIAFQTPETAGRIVRVNDWGPTTGKHLNQVATFALRVPSDTFEALVEQHLSGLAVTP